MQIMPLLLCDGYKVDHRRQYPDGTEVVYSNLTPRGSRIPGVDRVVFFGLQYFVQEYLINQFYEKFFLRPKTEVLQAYKRRMDNYLGKDSITVDHIAALHDLGYLPLHIKAVPEGTAVPLRTPMLTIKNTVPEFFWLTNKLETLLSNIMWMPCTSATTAWRYRKTFDYYADLTGADPAFVPWQGHDFSFRGMAGIEAAMLSGAAHLLSFTGTDTIPAIDFLEQYYHADSDLELIGGSVPATEHSVMCLGTADGEIETIKRLITETYPTGIVSIVADTWDFWKVITEYLPALRDVIMARNGKVVVRPDCYDEETSILTGSGWKRFKALEEDDLVAQVTDTGVVEFVKPDRIIAEQYAGEMIHFSDHVGKVDLLVTPNHRMVWQLYNSHEQIKTAAESRVGMHYRKMYRSAPSPNMGHELSWLDRFKIAFQADGSFPSKKTNVAVSGFRCYRFSFSKQRKIDRMLLICQNAGLRCSVHIEKARKNQVVMYVWVAADIDIRKDLSWVPGVSSLCSQWSKEFIEEVMYWDGSFRSESRAKFDTTNESVMNVVELVAMAAGYGCLVSRRSDDRQPHFSDVFTAHILSLPMAGSQSIQKTSKQYDGMVYCVTVPSGRVVVKRNRATAISGNSGDPVKIITGDDDKLPFTPEYKGAIDCLWRTFGGTFNSKGYRVLDSHIGLIYGDSITTDRQESILNRLHRMGFASSNVVLGVGSYSYQFTTRDTYGFAVKATYGQVNGEPREIFKSPKTDGGEKHSARGLLAVHNGVLHDRVTSFEEQTGDLQTVFFDGHLTRVETLDGIRRRLAAQSLDRKTDDHRDLCESH